jgi:hypothetical protein
MPHYHFNVFDGRGALDATGVELSGKAEARSRALATTGALIAEQAIYPQCDQSWSVEVTDHQGAVLYRLDFSCTTVDEVPRQFGSIALGRCM